MALGAGKTKMEDGVQTARLVWLKDERHEIQESGNGPRSEAIRNWLNCLVFEFAAGDRFCVRSGHNIDRLRALLQRPYDLL